MKDFNKSYTTFILRLRLSKPLVVWETQTLPSLFRTILKIALKLQPNAHSSGVDTRVCRETLSTRKTYFVLCVFMWVRSCTPRLLHFSLITLQLFFRVFKSTRKAGVRRSYMLPILLTTFFTVAIGQAQQTAPLGVDHKMTDKVKKKSQKRRKKMEKFVQRGKNRRNMVSTVKNI